MTDPFSGRVVVGGWVVALLATGMLVLSHWGGLALPGCGAGSPCAEAAASALGTLPGTSWPTSHVGFAFFAALLAGWVGGGTGRVGAAYVSLVRLGGGVSLFLVLALAVERLACLYCLVAHAGNLVAWVAVERILGRRLAVERRGAITLGVFIAVTGGVAVVESRRADQVADQAEEAVDRSVAEVIAQAEPEGTGFAGRYRAGAGPAALRIVVFSDYQCPVCVQVEEELQLALRERDDVAVTAKHFPLCSACNSYAREQGFNPHPNACRAAQVAEAAGILGGAEGFWAAHRELFRRGGSFDEAELDEMIRGWGLDGGAFREAMGGVDVEKALAGDIEEGVALGLHYTPMVFINGVQIRGVRQPGMLTRAIAQIAAASPAPLAWGAAGDQPPSAEEKFFGDWDAQPVMTLPPDLASVPMGAPAGAGVSTVVVWGDYQEPNTKTVDAILRHRIEQRGDVRYIFRHYPMDMGCNPMAPKTVHPQACLAARAVEAAAILGGPERWVAMHRWMWPNPHRFSEETFGKVARGLGFDPDLFLQTLRDPQVEAALQEDIAAGYELQIRSLPSIYINGKFLPRWSMNGEPQLNQLLDTLVRRDQGVMTR